MLRDGRDQHFSRFSLLPSRTHGRRKDARHYLAAAHISSPTAACEQRNPDSGNRVGEMSSTLRFHKDNLRHLSRFPDFFVTKRILSTSSFPFLFVQRKEKKCERSLGGRVMSLCFFFPLLFFEKKMEERRDNRRLMLSRPPFLPFSSRAKEKENEGKRKAGEGTGILLSSWKF